MSTIDKSTVCSAINDYCFKNIWNNPTSEYRINIEPFMVNSGRSYTGICFIGGWSLQLPTSHDAYVVYRFNLGIAHGVFNVPRDIWTDTTDLCNIHDVLVHIYLPNGKMIPKSSCYMYVESLSQVVTLAIRKSALSSIPRIDNTVYLTIYLDSDDVGNTTVYSHHTGSSDAILYTIQSNLDKKYQITTFINGYNYDPEDIPSIYKVGDYLDVIIDEDIIGAFDLDVTTNPHVFFSDRDELYKEIIHIPKSINPNNQIITFNTCSIYVRDMDRRGTYLHYTSDRTVNQITHNDLSIPSYLIDAHKDYLEVDHVTLHVKVKSHYKGNTLLRNSSYTDILYTTQSDAEIIDHLEGKIDPTLDFWKASNLEKHNYTEMMFDTPNVITADSLQYYIDALGYYHVVALLSQRIYATRITDALHPRLTYQKPYIWQNDELYPVVYLNGTKIHAQYVIYQNNTNATVSISLSDDIYTTVGDEVVVFFFQVGMEEVYTFTPTFTNTIVTIPSGKFTIYEKIDHGTINTTGMYTTSNVGYTVKEIRTGDILVVDNYDSTTTITFGYMNFDKIFFFYYDTSTHYIEKDLSEDISQHKNFVVDLVQRVAGTDVYVPMLNCNDVCVYFNNRYLVSGVDYTLNKVNAYDGSISMVQVIIQNMSYGSDDGPNRLEIIATSMVSDRIDNGFIIQDQASEDLDVDIWFKGMSALHVIGKYEDQVTDLGIGLLLPEGKYPDGSIFELKTAIPESVREILLPDKGVKDKATILAIELYLYKHLIPPTADVILPGSHKILSTYLNFIINGILASEIKLGYDPIVENMLEQLVTYDYLKQFDVMFRIDDPVNLRFVDIYPTYTDLLTTDNKLRLIIHTLVDYILPKDIDTSGVVYNE